MALPAAFNTVNLHAQAFNLDGTPAQGTVSFQMTDVVIVPGADSIIFPVKLVATFDASGQFTISLPVSDDPDVVGTWLYTVTESPTGSVGRVYQIAIPNAAIGTTLELADLAPSGPIDPMVPYLTITVGDTRYVPFKVVVNPSTDLRPLVPATTPVFWMDLGGSTEPANMGVNDVHIT